MQIGELVKARRYDEAIKAIQGLGDTPVPTQTVLEYAHALEMTGDYDGCLNILWSLWQNSHDEAIACRYVSALCRLGKREPENLRLLIKRHPACRYLKAAKGEMAMLDGDLETGLSLLGYRWAICPHANRRAELKCPTWDGKEQCRVLVVGEQGLGEEILLAGCFDALPAGSVVGCDHRLIDLFKRSFPHLIFGPRAALRYFDHPTCRAIEALDLIRITGRRGFSKPWLIPDHEKVKGFRVDLFTTFPDRIHVGLSWASTRANLGELKSAPLTDLIPIISDPCIAPLKLQYSAAIKDLYELQAAGHQLFEFDDLDLKNDIDGVAALIEALDVVVTTSNTVAHMAGALGKRTILLAPKTFVLWYWGREGDKTPWYPSIEIIRAKDGWPSAVRQAHDAIRATRSSPAAKTPTCAGQGDGEPALIPEVSMACGKTKSKTGKGKKPGKR